MQTHNNEEIVEVKKPYNAGEKDYLWMSWSDVLNGADISTSTWTAPTDWSLQQFTNAQATDKDGVVHNNVNGIFVSIPSSARGKYLFVNTITTNETPERRLIRTARITVKPI